MSKNQATESTAATATLTAEQLLAAPQNGLNLEPHADSMKGFRQQGAYFACLMSSPDVPDVFKEAFRAIYIDVLIDQSGFNHVYPHVMRHVHPFVMHYAYEVSSAPATVDAITDTLMQLAFSLVPFDALEAARVASFELIKDADGEGDERAIGEQGNDLASLLAAVLNHPELPAELSNAFGEAVAELFNALPAEQQRTVEITPSYIGALLAAHASKD